MATKTDPLVQPDYFLQKTPVYSGRTPMKGNDKSNALEDKWLPVRAKEDEISLYEKLCQSEFITAAIYLISGQKARCFSLEQSNGGSKEEKGNLLTLCSSALEKPWQL